MRVVCVFRCVDPARTVQRLCGRPGGRRGSLALVKAPHDLLGALLRVELPGGAGGTALGGGASRRPGPAGAALALREQLLQVQKRQRARPCLGVGEGAGAVGADLAHGGLQVVDERRLLDEVAVLRLLGDELQGAGQALVGQGPPLALE